MDAQKDNRPSRRNFLGFLGGLGAGAALGFPKPNLPAIVESEPTKVWNLEEVLQNPTDILKETENRIRNIPEDKRDFHMIDFLEVFTNEQSNQNEWLVEGYKKYGQQIIETRNKLILLNSQNINPDDSIAGFSDLIRPFKNLVDQLNSNEEFSMGSGEHNIHSDLVNNSVWFQSTKKDSTYRDEKRKVVENTEQIIQIKTIEENIRAEWNEVLKDQRLGRFEGWETWKPEGEKIQLGILEVINKHLPLALLRFKYSSFDPHRGYFRQTQPGTSAEFMTEYPFFAGVDALINKTGNAQDLIMEYVLGTIHELGHNVDIIIFKKTEDGSIFRSFHPQDYLDYLNEYVDMYLDFKELLDGNPFKGTSRITSNEVEGWTLDPMRIVEGFGADELTDEADVQAISVELNYLISICNILEDPANKDKYEQQIKNLNLENLFIHHPDGEFLNWKDRLGTEEYREPSQQAFKDSISSFDQISSKHLTELRTMMENVFLNNDNNYTDIDKAQIGRTIIQLKSMYLFASYVLLRGLEQTGQLQANDYLQYVYSSYLTPMINWQLAHANTGPLGEYLSFSGDLRELPERQLSTIFDMAQRSRKSSDYTKTYNPSLSLFLERFYEHVVNTQRKRAKLWGADTVGFDINPNEAYKDIARKVIHGVLKLKDLYGDYGKG